MTSKPDGQLTRAIHRYGEAYAARTWEGSIPYISDDPEEQEALDEAHAAIDHELRHSEKLLRGLIQRRIDAAVADAIHREHRSYYDRWEATADGRTTVFDIPRGASEGAALSLITNNWIYGRTASGRYRNPDLRVRKLED
jgi:hypothetical protein